MGAHEYDLPIIDVDPLEESVCQAKILHKHMWSDVGFGLTFLLGMVLSQQIPGTSEAAQIARTSLTFGCGLAVIGSLGMLHRDLFEYNSQESEVWWRDALFSQDIEQDTHSNKILTGVALSSIAILGVFSTFEPTSTAGNVAVLGAKIISAIMASAFTSRRVGENVTDDLG